MKNASYNDIHRTWPIFTVICHVCVRQQAAAVYVFNSFCSGFPSCRHVLVAMGFFAFFNCYTLRVNLSVAMVAMVNITYLHELEAAEAAGSNFTGSTCDGVDDGDNSTKLSNMTEQVVLSAVTSDFHKLF